MQRMYPTPKVPLTHGKVLEPTIAIAKAAQDVAASEYASASTEATIRTAIDKMIKANEDMVKANAKQTTNNNAAAAFDADVYRGNHPIAQKLSVIAEDHGANVVPTMAAAKTLQTEAGTKYLSATDQAGIDKAIANMLTANTAVKTANDLQTTANNLALSNSNNQAAADKIKKDKNDLDALIATLSDADFTFPALTLSSTVDKAAIITKIKTKTGFSTMSPEAQLLLVEGIISLDTTVDGKLKVTISPVGDTITTAKEITISGFKTKAEVAIDAMTIVDINAAIKKAEGTKISNAIEAKDYVFLTSIDVVVDGVTITVTLTAGAVNNVAGSIV